MSNSIGKLFTVTIFGESHGRCVGAVVDGCPAGLPLTTPDIQKEMDRRRPGAQIFSTARAEQDNVEILTGTFNGRTTGAPIVMLVWNRDADSTVYERIKDTPRPGHADYTAHRRYGGFNDYRGGGEFSGRITSGFVMAGAVAKKLCASRGIEVIAHTVAIGGIAPTLSASAQSIEEIKTALSTSPLYCADAGATEKMLAAIEQARSEGDSLGGVVEGIAFNVAAGLGEPIMDTVEGEMARALFAIPAVKGVEFGAGFGVAAKKGSENNDPYTLENGKIVTLSNNAGGILGGITNGMPVILRVAFKPTPSVSKEQKTVNMRELTETTLTVKGRHDVCIVPRAVVVVECMMAIVLCDLMLRSGRLPEVLK
jgi:chorismate synthase